MLGYNEAYFSVLFSRQFKVTPLKYISEKKMLLARQRLALSNMSVKEISDELGFENEFYFNTVFRKAIGIAPGKWRKQYFRQHSGEPQSRSFKGGSLLYIRPISARKAFLPAGLLSPLR